MAHRLRSMVLSALMLAALSTMATVGHAAPVTARAGLPIADKSIVDQVQYRRDYRGRGVGFGIGAGIIGGAIIGGAIARSYAPRPYYTYPRAYYYAPAPTYYAAPPPPAYYDDEVSYCMRRFKSYDPRSGTYLGYDGFRHTCP